MGEVFVAKGAGYQKVLVLHGQDSMTKRRSSMWQRKKGSWLVEDILAFKTKVGECMSWMSDKVGLVS